MVPFTCDLVIAYFKENLGWMKEFESFPFRTIYIYTKGKQPTLPFHRDTIKIITLENIGRCDHTYLYHIYTTYTTLPSVTIFTTGSTYLPHKHTHMRFIVPKVFETKDSVFRVVHEPDYKNKFKNFKLDTWRSTNKNNQENVGKNSLQPSLLRPFGKWYDKLFHGIDIHYVAYGGVFAVSNKHIHNRKQEFFKQLLDEFPRHSNPEVGHFFERAWLAIFHPIPKKCIFLENENPPPKNIRHVGGFTRKKLRRRRSRFT
jgi:hypothetical protein